MKYAWAPLAALLCASCADTGQDIVQFPLYVAGTERSEGFTAAGGVEVLLDRADLAFGSLYLCAGANAGDLCETARLQWLDSVVIDTLSAEPLLAGQLEGVTGSVRSWMYDLGLSSQLTRDEPFVLQAAEQLGGVSFVASGLAIIEGTTRPFSAAIAIAQSDATELGVPVIRKGTSEAFSHEVTADQLGLLIRFDPSSWLSGIDFRAGPSNLDQPFTVQPDTQAYRSLRNALLTAGRPSFQWDYVP